MNELKEITFKEQYIDEKPKYNYWRGIGVNIGELRLLDIVYEEGYSSGEFYIVSRLIPKIVYTSSDNIVLSETKRFKTKEEAMDEAKKCVENYFNLFFK